jgi:hypothetical protein
MEGTPPRKTWSNTEGHRIGEPIFETPNQYTSIPKGKDQKYDVATPTCYQRQPCQVGEERESQN